MYTQNQKKRALAKVRLRSYGIGGLCAYCTPVDLAVLLALGLKPTDKWHALRLEDMRRKGDCEPTWIYFEYTRPIGVDKWRPAAHSHDPP
mgnify:FL=1